MLKVKVLEDKRTKERVKVAFSLVEDDKNNSVVVVIDENKYADYEHLASFYTFVFASSKADLHFMREIADKVDYLPLLVGLNQPESPSVDVCKLFIKTDNKTVLYDQDLKKFNYVANLENMLDTDYSASIYKEFSKYLPKINEKEM